MLSILQKLKDNKILGNNRRLREFILPLNQRRYYPLVDEKDRMSQVLIDNQIPTPKLLGILDSVSQFKKLHEPLRNASSFVVKPARGAMGNGIMIVEEVDWDEAKKNTKFNTTRRSEITFNDFTYYLSLILSGVFSLDGQKDKVLFQEKIKIHPELGKISYRGIPDIRVILYCGFPVMAMIRLPSILSGGRGNLHQGAVGCGISLRDGEVTFVTQKNHCISHHPDFPDIKLQGMKIPQWNKILEIAARCGEVFPLKYIGVDIVVDPQLGPLVLEVNARPGLSIQIANQKGLLGPLEKVEQFKHHKWSIHDKIFCGKENF